MDLPLNFIQIFLLIKLPYRNCFLSLEICILAGGKVFWDHLKRILKYCLSFCCVTNTLKFKLLQYIFQNSLIMMLISYHSYLKMAESYHGSFWKIDMNWQMTCFFSWLIWKMQFLRDGKNYFLIRVTLMKTIYTKIIMLSKG